MSKIRSTSGFFIIVGYLSLFSFNTSHAAWFGEIKEPNTAKAIEQRIKPIGQVSVAGAPAPSAQATGPVDIGKSKYETFCKVCHAAGVAGAPKFKSAEWKPRMSAGMNSLLAVAIKGKGGMPPKGTCMSCTDDELKAAIQYMLPK